VGNSRGARKRARTPNLKKKKKKKKKLHEQSRIYDSNF
jgi:hypothetical protein